MANKSINDIPGTIAVGNNSVKFMSPKRKNLVSNVLKKAAKLSQQKKRKPMSEVWTRTSRKHGGSK